MSKNHQDVSIDDVCSNNVHTRANPTLPVSGFSRCPIDVAVHLLSNKWTIPIIRELLNGPKRPIELERTLKGISAKSLNERLQLLHNSGLVARISHPEVPPRVEYSLTTLGKEMEVILQALQVFGEKYMQHQSMPMYEQTCNSCLCQPGIEQPCPAIPELSARQSGKKSKD